MRALSLDESAILCEALPIRLGLADSLGGKVQLARRLPRAGHRGEKRMDEHTVLEHLGNLGVILLAMLLSTAVHYLF